MTGTTNILSNTTITPPKMGTAIGPMMSAPRPVEVSTGSSAKMVVAEVIRHGRQRRLPARMVVALICPMVWGRSFLKRWRR